MWRGEKAGREEDRTDSRDSEERKKKNNKRTGVREKAEDGR